MDRRSLSIYAGLAAPPCAVFGVVLAALFDPSFHWMGSELSHLGERPSGQALSVELVVEYPSILLFNGGLILAGMLGLPFAWLLHDDATHPLERSGATTLTVAFLGLLAVGAFFQPNPFHVPAWLATVLATTAFFWIYGAGLLQAGRVRYGSITIALGLSIVGIWLVWGAYVGGSGMAIPEFTVVAALSGWTFATALRTFEATEGRTLQRALRDLVDRVQTGSAD